MNEEIRKIGEAAAKLGGHDFMIDIFQALAANNIYVGFNWDGIKAKDGHVWFN